MLYHVKYHVAIVCAFFSLHKERNDSDDDDDDDDDADAISYELCLSLREKEIECSVSSKTWLHNQELPRQFAML